MRARRLYAVHIPKGAGPRGARGAIATRWLAGRLWPRGETVIVRVENSVWDPARRGQLQPSVVGLQTLARLREVFTVEPFAGELPADGPTPTVAAPPAPAAAPARREGERLAARLRPAPREVDDEENDEDEPAQPDKGSGSWKWRDPEARPCTRCGTMFNPFSRGAHRRPDGQLCVRPKRRRAPPSMAARMLVVRQSQRT